MTDSDRLSGLVLLNKEEGMSSHTAVSRVKRLFGIDKAGHTGTLDPMATGVLPVLIGRAVKASEFMLTARKHYLATLLLGVETDTEDVTGKIIATSERIPDEREVRETVNTFLGKSMQVPPMYSALKVGGKKLYEIARAGGEVEREPREITVYKIECSRVNEREYTLEVECSKGTYIRTLCADIGKRLGVGGAMKSLSRMSAAGFPLSECHTLSELEAMCEEERLLQVLPTERIFLSLRKVTLEPFFARLALSGLEIYLKKIGESIPLGERVALYDASGFFAVGEVREFDTGLAIKPIRQLR